MLIFLGFVGVGGSGGSGGSGGLPLKKAYQFDAYSSRYSNIGFPARSLSYKKALQLSDTSVSFQNSSPLYGYSLVGNHLPPKPSSTSRLINSHCKFPSVQFFP